MVEKPLIILTRPKPQAERFATALENRIGDTADIILAPVMAIYSQKHDPVPARAELIVTSENALFALNSDYLDKNVAYCVGDQTAATATALGLRAISVNGTAKDIVSYLAENKPSQELIYLRGEKIHLDISAQLQKLGIRVEDRVTYSQQPESISDNVKTRVTEADDVIFPLFSVNSARNLIKEIDVASRNIRVVAMSAAIAEVVKNAGCQHIKIAAHPDRKNMLNAIEGSLDLKSDEVEEYRVSESADQDKNQREERPSKGVPIFLGGIGAAVAGLVAVLAAPHLISGQSAEQIEALTQSLNSQAEDIQRLDQATAGIETNISGFVSENDALNSDIETRLAEVDARFTAIETTIAALEEQLKELKQRPLDADAAASAAIETFEQELASMTARLQAQAEMIAVLEATPKPSEIAARNIAFDALIQQIRQGSPFGSELDDLEEVWDAELPVALRENQQGLNTFAQLQNEFPDLARNVLKAASEQESETSGSLSAFLRHQLGARPLTPQEGDSTAAILSRAEAALNAEEISTTLAELAELEPDSQEILDDWQSRLKNLHAVNQSLNMLRQSIRGDE